MFIRLSGTKSENYMGFDFITGPELIEKFQYQLIRYGFADLLIMGSLVGWLYNKIARE